MKNRLQALERLTELNEVHCNSCEDPNQLLGGYCKETCKIGEEIFNIGNLLNKETQQIRKGKEQYTEMDPSKENYYLLKDMEKSDRAITKIFKITIYKLTKLKIEWKVPKKFERVIE